MSRALGLPETREGRWLSKARALAAYRADTGTWPPASSPDRETRLLGQWLGQQRKFAKAEVINPERRAHLDATAPGWFGGRARAWTVQAEATLVFHAATGRWPSTATQDPGERQLGEWLSHQRSLAKAGSLELTPQRRADLDTAAPGWADPRGDAWGAAATALVAHRLAAGRWPSQVGDTRAERQLAMWFKRQRSAAASGSSCLTTARWAHLDLVAPGWLEPMGAPWTASADAVSAHRAQTGRWPSLGSVDAAERKLGRWLVNQRQHARNGAKRFGPERRAYLDEVAPGWARA